MTLLAMTAESPQEVEVSSDEKVPQRLAYARAEVEVWIDMNNIPPAVLKWPDRPLFFAAKMAHNWSSLG